MFQELRGMYVCVIIENEEYTGYLLEEKTLRGKAFIVIENDSFKTCCAVEQIQVIAINKAKNGLPIVTDPRLTFLLISIK